MKRVVDNSQVAHLWANKSQSGARSNNGNFYFEGATIYSYGRHFAIARHVTKLNGESAILMTWRQYSVSTAQHISYTQRALSFTQKDSVFYVRDPSQDADGCLRDFESEINKELFALGSLQNKPRIRKATIDKQKAEIARFVEMKNRFGESFIEGYAPTKIDEDFGAIADQMEKEKQEREEKARKARLLAEKKERAALARKYGPQKSWPDLWRREGYGTPYPILSHIKKEKYALLRCEESEQEVITSHGARFPFSHAALAFRKLQKMFAIKTGKPVFVGAIDPNNKIKIGGYAIDSISPGGEIVAGCHIVKWSEVVLCAERLAAIMGNEKVYGEV